MDKLSFSKAKQLFFQTNPRELERARFAFLFEKGSKEEGLTQLKAYQNQDGGFGNGIEPDFWLPTSSPMASWAAGQILLEIDADPEHEIVQLLLDYLVDTIHPETGMWDSVLPEVNDYPHAPWWHWQEGVQENWMFNPSAELAGFLVHWSEKDSEAAQLGWQSIAKAVEHVMAKREMDKHEVANYLQLMKIMQPYESEFQLHTDHPLESVAEQVMMLAEKNINKDPSTWAEDSYQPMPLDFVEDPTDPLCARLGSLVEAEIQFRLKQLEKAGMWDIPWSWGSYPAEFEIAKKQWRGILALQTLKQLRAFGYVEEI